MVNLGLIGAGRWGRNYIRTLETMPGVRLAAVASRNPKTQTRVGSDVQVLLEWESILNLGLDGLILAVPPTVQPKIALNAIEVGLPLLLEKPMALNLNLAQEIANQARARNVYVAVNHIYLHHPAFIQLRHTLVESGEPITAIRTHSGNHGPFRTEWNALWDWGPHDIAMALALTGQPATLISAQKESPPDAPPGAGRYTLEIALANQVNAHLKFGNLMPKRIRQMTVSTTSGEYGFDEQNEHGLTHCARVQPAGKIKPLNRAVEVFVQRICGKAGFSPSISGSIAVVDLLAQAMRMTEV